jgi:hypothetical protein
MSDEKDTFRDIALDAIVRLYAEECCVEGEFGVGDPSEDFHEESTALSARVKALDQLSE